MLIITEKPSVAKDFAKALECSFSASDKTYKSRDGKISIVHCVGHLFNLQQPDFYDERFKHWNQLPIIPKEFAHSLNPQTDDINTVEKFTKAPKYFNEASILSFMENPKSIESG